MNTQTSEIIPIETIGQRIKWIRGRKVMLDFDLAELYQVSTKRLNEQVNRNMKRFPTDFMFRITQTELEILNRSQFATSSQKHRDPKYLPLAFTEHGIAMLSSILKSDRAVQMNIFIVRVFIKLRELLATNDELALKVELITQRQYRSDEKIEEVWSVLKKLIDQPFKPKYHLGFTPNDKRD